MSTVFKPIAKSIITALIGLFPAVLLLQGCAIYTVASTTAKVATKTVGAAVDVVTAPVGLLTGDDDDDEKSDKGDED